VDLRLSGRRALITGASSGLGLACAQALAMEGATVAIAARSADRLADAAATIDGNVIRISADVSTTEAVEEMIAHAE